MNKRWIVSALGLLVAACDDKPRPAPMAVPTARPTAAPTGQPTAPTGQVAAPAGATAGTVSALGLTFTVPSEWKSVPPANAMRLAELQVPDPSGDAAQSCLVVVSTAGGDVASNLSRWQGQVRNPVGGPAKTRTVGGLAVHVLELTGGFSPGMGDTTVRENWTLRGAIIETPQGLLFIKMTGPAAPMGTAGSAFESMVDGLKPS